MMLNCQVLLIQPPFASIATPSLGLSLLKAEIEQLGMTCKILYSNFIFSKLLGNDLYEDICHISGRNIFAEMIFSPFAYVRKSSDYKSRHNSIFSELDYQASKTKRKITAEEILSITQLVPKFLEELKKIILSINPTIVGISSLYQQTSASVSISNLIKKINKDIIVVLGGGNVLPPMGEEILRITPSIDYMFAGEADFQFPKFCADIIKTKNFGVNLSRKFIICDPVKNLDSLPYPDYDDFFIQKDLFEINYEFSLGFESTRGCWWSFHSHCLFCGVNGINSKYRKKTAKRMKNELNFLCKKYHPDYIYAGDNVMPRDYPNKLYKSFHKLDCLQSIFLEIRINLTFKELYFIKRAGVNYVQPGIESLNSHLLKLLKKGSSAASNIKFLRNCLTLGIKPCWNMLYSICGEIEEDYEKIIQLLPILHHLDPPQHTGSVRIQRFSPLFNEKERYAIQNLRPLDTYKFIFPEKCDLFKVALFFEGDYQNAFKNEKLTQNFLNAIELWQNLHKPDHEKPKLVLFDLNDEFFMLQDSRLIAKVPFVILSKNHFDIIKLTRKPIKTNSLLSYVKENNLSNEFELLRENNYILEIDDVFISLIIEPMRVVELENRNESN